MADGYYSDDYQTRQLPQQPAQPQYQQQYDYQYQQPYQQQFYYQQQPEPTSTGQWVLNLFLLCIPIVGLVLLFVWAFGSGTELSKRNWARANLIWILVGIILITVFVVLAMVTGISYSDYFRFRS